MIEINEIKIALGSIIENIPIEKKFNLKKGLYLISLALDKD